MPFEFPTRDYHPATVERSSQQRRKSPIPQIKLPKDKNNLDVQIDDRVVRLTNLNKLFWPKHGVTKRDLIQYYLDMAPVLLPHVIDRAMVMKRYPHGAEGEFFFMKRAPSPRPDWIEIEVDVIGAIDVVAARVPLVKIDAAEIDDPHQRRDILNHRKVDDVP